MASKCRKFVPNMFNKTKCQACFGSKEAHSAEALENNKATRKVSKCGYLFVAPNFDFSNPLDRTRRWQRRFFRLYDDGELTFCVDDHADTVPQGSVDMNKCTDILDAEVTTSHVNSIAVVTPEKTEYIKADSKEEIQWWHDVLVKFPNSMKTLKIRRKPNFIISSNKENVQPVENEENTEKPGTMEEGKGQHQQQGTLAPHSTFKGLRNLKHKSDKQHQEGMRKSSSLHDLTAQDKELSCSLASSRFLSCSGDHLDSLDTDEDDEEEVNKSEEQEVFSAHPGSPMRLKSRSSSEQSGGPLQNSSTSHASALNSSSTYSSTSSINSATARSSFDDRASSSGMKTSAGRESSRQQRHEQGSSFSAPLTRAQECNSSMESVEHRPTTMAGFRRLEADDATQNMSADETESNETDELKMARSSELSASSRAHPSASSSEGSPTKFEDLVYMKKGWLIKQGLSDRESQKHWFVLAGNSLRYYRDAKAEESNNLDGRIDLSTCYEISELSTPRNYGFKVKTQNGEYTLAAMTSGIRINWMKALHLCMDLHRSSNQGLSATLAGKTVKGLSENVDTTSGSLASGSIACSAVGTGNRGETAFQLVGRRDPGKKEMKNVRRQHSDVNSGNSKMLSVKEFTGELDVAESLSSSSGTSITDGQQELTPSAHCDHDSERLETLPKASKIPRHHSPSTDYLLWSQASGLPLKRYVEGSDNILAAPVLHSPERGRSRRNTSSDSGKDDEKQETVGCGKSFSSQSKEKRVAKTPIVHPPQDEDLEYHRSSGSGQTDSSQVPSDAEDDLNMTTSSEENFQAGGGCDEHDGIRSDSIGEGSMMVELLESEVECLKERLDETQSQLVKMHETNIDLKSRLQKETSQGMECSYRDGSGRWSQPSIQQIDPSQVQTLKRQLKDAKDTVQKQRIEIESLKSKLDMSVSKLTGTEKALSEALKEYKHEKDKFLKLSTEWNRRIRTLEGQMKDGTHKQERTRESLLVKERECRRLELEVKQHQQKTREQDREILKLKAVEHEYNQLKEQLDNRDRELFSAHEELRERDSDMDTIKSAFQQRMRDIECEFSRERDDLEKHLEDLKKQLCTAQVQQSTLQDNMTTNMADLLKEKDDIIAQLEEKLIENDNKMVDMQEELQAEMGENSDLAHNLEILQSEKQKLQDQIDSIEKHVMSLKSKVVDLEKDNGMLRQNLDRLRQENSQLSNHLSKTPASSSDPEKLVLERNIQDLNKQIQSMQLKLMERFEDLDHADSEQDDVLHNILVLDSDLKEVNKLLMQLHSQFSRYLSTLSGEAKLEAVSLAEMVDDIGQRCLLLQETLQESSLGVASDSSDCDYLHTITVSVSSSNSVILDEYRNLKSKFDRVVAELKKLKKEMNKVYNSKEELQRKDKQSQDKVGSMERSYSQQVENLVQRVDQLSKKLASQCSTSALRAKLELSASPVQCKKADVAEDIEQHLTHLENRINVMEKILAEASTGPSSKSLGGHLHSSQPGMDNKEIVARLKEMRVRLENTSKELKDIVKDLPGSSSSFPPEHIARQQVLVSRLDSCSQKLDHMTHMVQNEGAKKSLESSDNAEHGNLAGCSSVVKSSASSMGRCMLEIMERLQEIGEQLDCLDDGTEDSDEEDEGTNVDEVREQLASLCEYVKQHSKFSDYDWHMMQLLMAQKGVLCKDEMEAGPSDSADSETKLQAYADRLSLESLILVEMSHLLENKEETEKEEHRDPVIRELSVMNSKVLSLQQKLDKELKTMNLTADSADVLKVQAGIMAEKIMLEGQLFSSAFAHSCPLNEENDKEEESKKSQSKLLAAEAILRSQLDSHIGHNLDQTCDELWSSASHLTTRSLVQGELTFALNNLKRHFRENPRITQSVGCVRDYAFQQLKERHKAVLDVCQLYQEKMIQAFAIIISKESEEMTIVEGPENVLDTVCSEISTIMEKNIQHYKEKVRSAEDTQTAHRWDMMVNKLRVDREGVLNGIRQAHTACFGRTDCEKLEVPTQSLDSSINNFAEIVSLRAIMIANFDFVAELLRIGSSSILADMEVEEEEEEDDDDDDEDGGQQTLQKGVVSFVHKLAEALRCEAKSKHSQAVQIAKDRGITAGVIPNIPYLQNTSQFNEILMREAVFAAQTMFMMYKLKLFHEQEMDALKAVRPARTRPQQSMEDNQAFDETDLSQILLPLEEVLDTKHDDEMETLRVIASQVGKLGGVVTGHDWRKVEEHLRQLEQKVQEELKLAEERHQVHVDLFKQEENKVENVWEESQQERAHFEERCAALELELRSISNQHDDEVERMRQDVMTAVSAIRANEEESETHLSDKVQILTKQMMLQKEKYMHFLDKLKGQVKGVDKYRLVELLNKELKDISDSKQLSDDEYVPPLPSQPPPDSPVAEEKSLKMEEELDLLKKEKDEALAEETRNTKAALDAMRKAYEEELQQEQSKYRECLTTMYNEDFVTEIRRRHQVELEKTQDELKQVKMHYLSKCEDIKLLEVKLGQTKQDYESHINQLIKSNDHLDDMVNQQIEGLKDFIKNRPASLTSGSATMEEELYDAQIMIRVKDAELQKLRSQVKTLENSLHLTTEEHRETMTQYLQALKENQEMRKEYQTEATSLREQLEKALRDLGVKKPIRRTPSFHQRARSPSPSSAAAPRRDSASTASEHASRDSNRRRRIDPKDLRRSKSSPSLPFIFDAKGIASVMMKTPGKERRTSQKN